MESKIHPFQAAGLGKAPFICIDIIEKRGPITMPDGSQCGSPGQPMGHCEYCGTGIAFCCVIKSSDGKEFIVGTDCVSKTTPNDDRLVKVVKEKKKDIGRKKRQAEAKARREKALQAERDRNGGLTDYELYQQQAEQARRARQSRIESISDDLNRYADALQDGRGGFRDSISAGLRSGDLPQGRGLTIMIEILAKQYGRKNSKAYKQAAEKIEKDFENFINVINDEGE